MINFFFKVLSKDTPLLVCEVWNVVVTDLTHLPLDKMAAVLADNIFKCIFFIENDRIPTQISLKFVPKSPINDKLALFQVIAWRWIGDKP